MRFIFLSILELRRLRLKVLGPGPHRGVAVRASAGQTEPGWEGAVQSQGRKVTGNRVRHEAPAWDVCDNFIMPDGGTSRRVRSKHDTRPVSHVCSLRHHHRPELIGSWVNIWPKASNEILSLKRWRPCLFLMTTAVRPEPIGSRVNIWPKLSNEILSLKNLHGETQSLVPIGCWVWLIAEFPREERECSL